MITKDNPGVEANGRGRGRRWVRYALPLFGPARFLTEKGMVFRVLSVQFHYLASLTGCVFGTEEYDGCR